MKVIYSDFSDLVYGDQYDYLTTDSRSVFDAPRTIFAALRTDVGDGHRYIRQLIDAGVKAFVVEYIPDDCLDSDATFYLTDSVENALRRMAYARVRGNENGIVVAGSKGKTKVKELIYQTLLRMGRRVRRSPGSWNSSVGVALSLWEARRGFSSNDHDFTIVTEAAIDGPGQAGKILECIAGSHRIGILTEVTDEHDEAFPSHEAKVREKLRLLSSCHTIIYNDSSPEVEPLLREVCPDARLIAVSPTDLPADCPTVSHALAKAALGLETMPRIPLVSTRMDITESTNGNIILRNHFTADIRSLETTLDVMRRHLTQARTPVLVLGHMVEGTPEQAAALAAKFGIESVLPVADAAGFMAEYPIEKFQNSFIVVFGKSEDGFDDIAAGLRSAAHDTTLEVDLDALVHNYNFHRAHLPKGMGIIAMVKASAYGMGAVEVGKTLQSQGAAALAVAVIDEGVELRRAGITMPVIVLNPVTNRYTSLFANRLEPAVFSIEELDRLIREAGRADVWHYPVHIKFDTGMHRVGFLEHQLPELIERLKRPDASRVRVVSVFSHLATADCLDMDAYTAGQLATFDRMCGILRDGLGHGFMRHILNSAGMLRFGVQTAGRYELARLGIGLYGIIPFESPESRRLRTVAALRTTIISLKHWPAGTPVGYGCRGRVERPSIVATIPVGYADGINRRLGCGAASFMVRGVECPTVGNICMDLCMIDVTDVPGVALGDSVEVFGPSMPVQRLADILGTIPYEIFTSVSQRVKRTYFRH